VLEEMDDGLEVAVPSVVETGTDVLDESTSTGIRTTLEEGC